MVTSNSIDNTITDNNFTANRSTAGTAVAILAGHNDNSNTDSNAKLESRVAGASGGDPFVRVNVTGITTYTYGIDNSDSDILKMNVNATSMSDGTNLWAMTSAGERTMPLQPAFYAYLSATATNVTGDATVYTVAFNTEIYDQNSDFNTGTYTFTAPVTGKYFLSTVIRGEDLDAAVYTQYRADFNTSNHYIPCFINKGGSYETASGSGYLGFGNSVITDMDSGDTATVEIKVSGGAKSVDISGTINVSYFSGALIC